MNILGDLELLQVPFQNTQPKEINHMNYGK